MERINVINVYDQQGNLINIIFGSDLHVESLPCGNAYAPSAHGVRDGKHVVAGIMSCANWSAR